MMRAMRTGLWLFCICWVGWANGVAAETKNTGEDTAPVAITAEDVQQDQHVLIDPPSHPPLPNTITHSAEENTNPRSTHRQHSRAYRLPALHAREDDNNDMSLSTSTSDVQTRTAAHQRRQSPNALSMLFGYLPPVLDSFYTPINDLFRVVIDDLQAQGILANVNVSTKFRVTDNVRALAIANTFQLMTEDKAAGLIGVGGSWTEDAASATAITQTPYCEAISISGVLSNPASYPTLFRTIGSAEQTLLGSSAFILDQGWGHYAALITPQDPLIASTNLQTIEGVLAPSALFVLPPDPTEAQCKDILLQIVSSQLAIIASGMSGTLFLPILRAAKSLGLIKPSILYIMSATAYRLIYSIVSQTGEMDILEGAIVMREITGQGPVYESLKARWNTTAFRTRYPLLSDVPFLPEPYHFFHACLELLMRGYDRVLRITNVSSFENVTATQLPFLVSNVSAPKDTFGFPNVDTILGKINFGPSNTRLITFEYNYVTSGALNPFAYWTAATRILNYTAPILWRDGQKPVDYLARAPDEEDNSFLITKVFAPIIIVFGLVMMCAVVFLLRQHLKKKREIDVAPKPLLPLLTVDIKSPAQKAMEMLQEVKADLRRRRLTPYEIDFIIEVLSTGTLGFNPDINELEDGHGARVDNETRAWVMDLLAASPSHPSTTSGPVTGSNGNMIGRQGSDGVPGSSPSTTADIRRTSRSALEKSLENQREREKRGSVEESSRGRRSITDVNAQHVIRNLEEGNIAQNAQASSLRQRRGSTPNARKTPAPLLESSVESAGVEGSSSAASWSTKPFGDCTADEGLPRDLNLLDQVKITDYLTVWYHSWNFDMFHFTEMTNGHPLFYSGLYLLQSTETLGQLQLDTEKFKRWLLLMEAEYHPHPYHNATHAADVLHGLNYLLLEDPMGMYYTPLEMLALVLGAIGHDIDHPGYNNAFLVKSRHPWAVLYCDSAVLEFHHCAHLFTMTLNSPWNIFADLTNDEYDEVRKMVIKLILATDMSKHFEYINKFKSKMSAGSLTIQVDVGQESRLMVAEIAMKCSDLCNPTKTFALSKKWTDAVMEEFYMQGDKEKELGLPVSQFMDRSNTNVPKCQIGFIDFLVAPLYDAWNTYHNADDKTLKIVREIAKNRSKWAGLTISQQLQQQQQSQHAALLAAQMTATHFSSLPVGGSANTSSQGIGVSATSIPSRYPSVNRPTAQHLHNYTTNANTSGASIVQSPGSSGSFPVGNAMQESLVVVEMPSGLPVLPKSNAALMPVSTGSLPHPRSLLESAASQPFSIRSNDSREGGGIIMNTFDFDHSTPS